MKIISINNNFNQSRVNQNKANQKQNPSFSALVKQNPGGFPVSLNWLLENSQSVISRLGEKYDVKLTYLIEEHSKKRMPLNKRLTEGSEKGGNIKPSIKHILKVELQDIEHPQKHYMKEKDVSKELRLLMSHPVFTPDKTLKKPSININLNEWLEKQEGSFASFFAIF